MILSFLGKGGSGKSSLSTQMALFFHQKNKEVLAIDADHNLDLSFNLSSNYKINNVNYFGSSLPEIQEFLGLSKEEKYDQVFLQNKMKKFYFGKKADEFTKKYSNLITDRLFLMAAGPQTNEVLHGKACSHILSTPLKIYLPLLSLEDDQVVLVDEKAGADGVSTGIITGVDLAIIAVEPALHSIKTAIQLSELLSFYETPYILVANKVNGKDDIDFVNNEMNKKIDIFLKFSNQVRRNPGLLNEDYLEDLEKIYQQARQFNQSDRLTRTIKKFKRNNSFN